MKIGKANYSGSTKESFKIQDGDNVYRILPPLGDLADKGKYATYYRVVWGYKGSDGKHKPFASPFEKNFRTQMIEVDCAAFRKSEALKEEYNKMVANSKELIKKGVPLTEAIKTELADKKKKMMDFNVESRYFLNAIDLDGKIGLLKLGSRAFNQFKNLAKDFEKKGIDVSGVNGGRFFNFHRSGEGFDTVYTVTEYKENKEVVIDGVKEIVQRSIPHDLDESIINRLATEAFELDKLYPTPTSAEVQEMVDAVNNLDEASAAKVIDRILGDSSSSSQSSAIQTEAEKAAKTELSQAKSEPVVTKTTESVLANVTASPSEPKAEPLEAKAEVEATVETTTLASGETVNTSTGEVMEETTEVATAPTPPQAQTDEDFLASLRM